MKQSYESQIQELNNKLKQHHSANSQASVTTQRVAIRPKPSLPVIEESVLSYSQCSNDPKEKAYFQKIMGNKRFRTVLRYRASIDGWMADDFHRKVKGKKRTVSLFKIKENGNCVGGFTSAEWKSPEESIWVKDSTAMVFNLTTQELFETQDDTKAI